MLSKGAKVDLFVTAIENGGKWVQLWAQIDPQGGQELENLMGEVDTLQKSTVDSVDSLSVGDVYLAKYQEDSKWYRAKVVETNKHGQSAKVFFIDYGNFECVSLGDIVKGQAKHFKLPPQAVPFIIADMLPLNGRSFSQDTMSYLGENLTYGEFSGEILKEGTVGNPPTVRVFDGLGSSEPIYKKFVIDGTVVEYDNSHLSQESIPKTLLENSCKYHVYLTFYESPVNFWIQLTNHESILDELHAGIEETFKTSGLPSKTDVDVGSICLAKYSETGTLYRAVVTNLMGDGTCETTFIDYGNSEITVLADLKQMPSKYCKLPAQAVQCSLHGAVASSKDFQRFLECETLYAKVLSSTASGLHIVQLHVQEGDFSEPTSPKDVSTRTVSRGFGRQSPGKLREPELKPVVYRDAEREVSPKPAKFNPLQFDLGSYIDICVSHVEQSGQFHCQLLENAHKLEMLMADLQQCYGPGSKSLSEVTPGSPGVIQDIKDRIIYRAQVVSMDMNQVHVKYVDFGNVETFHKRYIYQINAAHTTLPTQAISCSLAGSDGCDTTAIARTLERYNSRIAVVGKVVMKTGHRYEMELVDTRDGQDVNLADLVRQLMMIPSPNNPRTRSESNSSRTTGKVSRQSSVTQFTTPSLEVGNWEEVIVTYIVDPEHFYCQFTRSAGELEVLMAEIQQYCASPDLGSVNSIGLGQPCLAQYSEDKVWYRALVTGMMASGQFEVMFVDYGNTDVVGHPQMRAITSNFLNLPKQCFRCGLNSILPGEDGIWNSEEIDALYNMTAERSQKVYIYAFYEPDEQYLVEVFDGQTNVNETLGQMFGKLNSNRRNVGPPQMPTGPCVGSASSVTSDTGSNTWASWQGANAKETPQQTRLPELPKLTLKVEDYVDVWIIYSESPSCFWCQLDRGASELDTLMDNLNAEYSKLQPGECCLPYAVQGQVCCAKFSEDNQWYRARIVEVSGPKLKLHFVDYGNMEFSTVEDTKVLSKAFMRVPNQAFQCSLTGLQPTGGTWSTEACDKFEEIALDQKLVAAIVEKCKDDSYLVELVNGTKQVHEELIRAGFGVSTSSPRPAAPVTGHARHSSGSSSSSRASNRSNSRGVTPNRAVAGSQQPPAIDVRFKYEWPKNNSFLDVNVVHVLNPGHFYCQSTACSAELEQLMKSLESEYEALSADDLMLTQPKKGLVCCAKFSEDNSWYRAQIVEYDGHSKVNVCFVDYGNDEWMGVDRIKMLRRSHLDLPVQAIKCSLEGLTANSWSEQVTAKFEYLTIDKNLIANIIKQDANGSFKLKLVDSSRGANVDIAHELVASGLVAGEESTVTVTPLDIVEGKSYRCTLTWVTHPKEFWCQPTRSARDLSTLSEKMTSYYSGINPGTDTLARPSKGQVCATRFSADGGWYRSTIIALSPDKTKAKVRFLDYGNVEKVPVSSLKKLKGEYATLSAQVFLSALHGIEMTNGQWAQHVVDEFQRLMEQTITCRVLRRAGELTYVSIQDETGQDVVQKLSSGENARHNNHPEARIQPKSGGSAGFGKRETSAAGWGAAAGELTSNVAGGTWDAGGGASGSWDVGPNATQQAAGAAASEQAVPARRTVPPQQLSSVVENFKIGYRMTVVITFVENANNFWCQPVENALELEGVMEHLETHYKDARPSLPSPKSGDVCAAKYSEDGAWYRAIVTKMHSPSQVEIHFVDYGNSETTEASSLKQLIPELAKLPKQAFQCRFAGSTVDFPSEAKGKLEELADAKEFQMTVMGIKKSHVDVELVTDEVINIHASMKEQFGLTQPKTVAQGGPLPSYLDPIVPKERVALYVTSVDSPISFHVQLASQEAEIAGMADQLTATYDALGPDESRLRLVQPKAVCVARFSEDGAWYRAVILNVTGDEATVLFVDYGNTDVVQVAELKEVTAEILAVPPYGINCSLIDVRPPLGGWTDEHKAKFEELALEDGVITEGKFCSEMHPTKVKFFVNGEDIASHFVLSDGSEDVPAVVESAQPAAAVTPDKRVAVQVLSYPTAAIPKGRIPVYVTIVESPGNFYIQLASKENEIADMADKLTEEYEALGPEKGSMKEVKCGAPCVAKFSDGAWYRAVITELDGDIAKVKFIDYGNTDTVPISGIKEVSDNVQSFPPYAIQCSLSGANPPQEGWTEDHKVTFEVLTLEEGKVTEVEFLDQDEPVHVRLYSNGEDIGHKFALSDTKVTLPHEPEHHPSPDIEEEPHDTQSPAQTADEALSSASLEVPEPVAFVEIPPTSKVVLDQPATLDMYPTPLVPEGREAVFVTAVTSPCSFYVHLASQEDKVLEMSDKLTAEYGSLGPEELALAEAKPSSVCIAKFSEDGAWYRAIVTSVDGDVAEVMFVDFGNTDMVPISELKLVKTELLSLAPLALNCCLSEASDPPGGWMEEHRIQFEELTLGEDASTEAEFLYNATPLPVKFYVNGEDIGPQFGIVSDAKSEASDQVAQTDAVIVEQQPMVDNAPETAMLYTSMVMPVGQFSAYVSHVESLSEIYLQLQETEDALNQLMEEVELAYSTLSDNDLKLTEANVGQACCARFSQDDALYRAQVIASNDSQVTVFFVDYGNSETVDISRLRLLRKELAVLPPFGLKVSLADITIPPDGWPENSSEELEVLVHEKLLTVNITASGTVLLLDGEQNINQQVKSKLPQPESATSTEEPEQVSISRDAELVKSSIEPSETSMLAFNLKGKERDVFMSAVESPSQFYLHLCGDKDQELTAMMERLCFVHGNSGQQMESPQEGQVCCAKYAGDDLWYRAVVKDTTSEGVTVLFIDYGNTETVPASEVLHLDEEFKDIPPFGLEAFLSGSEPSCEWGEDDINSFIDVTNEKALRASFLTAQAPYEVVLHYDANDLGIQFGLKSRSLAEAIVGEVLSAALMDQQNVAAHNLADKGPDVQEVSEDIVPASVDGTALAAELFAIGEKTEVLVSHIDSPSEFYLQLVKLEKELQTLTANLAAAMSEMSENPVTHPEQGAMYAAKYTDGEWYRARTLALGERDLHVHFVDFGNKDKVSLSDLRELPSSCEKTRPQAIPCALAGVQAPQEGWTDECFTKFEELVLDKKLLAEFIQGSKERDDCDSQVCYVELRDMGISVAKGLLDSGLAVEDLSTAPPSKVLDLTLDMTLNATVNNEVGADVGNTLASRIGSLVSTCTLDFVVPCKLEGYVSHIESPGEFWVQLKANESTLELLASDMQDIDSHVVVPPDFVSGLVVGTEIAAHSSEDESWYRARVLATNNGQIDVMFIDYGNTELLSEDRILPLPTQLLSTPAQAMLCCLAEVRPVEEAWSEEAQSSFTDLTLDRKLLIEVLAKQEDVCKARLLDMGLSLGKKLVDAGLALMVEPDRSNLLDTTLLSLKFEEPTLCVGESVEVYVTEWKTPGQFSCQLAKSSTELPLLMDRIQDIYKSTTPKLDQPTPGTACVARYSQDNNWYRAEILSQHDNDVEVCFVDYGNSEVVSSSEVCGISTDLLGLPRQVFPSALACVRPLADTWDEASCGRFEELVGGDAKPLLAKILRLHMSDIGGDQSAMVELFDGDVSVGQQLIDGGYAYHVQFNSDDDETLGAEDIFETDLEKSFTITAAEIVAQVLARASSEIEAEDDSVDSLPGDLESTRLEEVPQQLEKNAVATSALEIDSVVLVTYVRGESPDNFLVQRSGADEIVSKLTAEIADVVESETESNQDGKEWDPTQLVAGDMCLALYAMDNAWYRAKIISIKEDKFDVMMVDVGLKKTVAGDKLKSLPDQFSNVPTQTIQCSLAGIETEEWSGEAKTYFHQMCYGNNLSATVVSRTDDVYDIYLYDMGDRSGESMNKILVEEGFAWLTPNTEIEDDLDDPQKEQQQEELENSFLEMTLHKSNSLGSLTDNTKEEINGEGLSFTYQCFEDGDEVDMLMFSASDPDNIILQPAITENHLLELMSQLADTFEVNESEITREVYLGQPVAAKFSEDRSWYRAKVFAIGKDKVDVYYVDYGNAEAVTWDNLRSLPADMVELPAQAVLCSLADVKPVGITWDKDAGKTLEKIFCGETAEGKGNITKVTVNCVEEDNRIVASLKTSAGVDARESLIKKKIALDVNAPEDELLAEGELELSEEEQVESNRPSMPSPEDEERQASDPLSDHFPVVELPSQNESVDVLLSHCVSPGLFWCQRNAEQVSDLMDRLQEYYSNTDLNSLEEAEEGLACCAQYSEDNFWYRSKVESCCGEVLNVKFVDYGNSETTTLDMVKPLVEQFATVPPYAMQCTLAGVQPRNGIEWSEASGTAFKELADQGMLMEVIARPATNLSLVVSLSQRSSGGTVAETLINAGHAKPTDDTDEDGSGDCKQIADLNRRTQGNMASQASPDEGFVSPSDEAKPVS